MKYITEIQKKEIDKKYFPNGFLYETKNFDPTSYSNSKRFDEPFESLEEYERAVKSVRHSNALRFYYNIRYLNEVEFIKEINNQYLNYTLENKENAELWLSLTYDLVLKGFSVAGKIKDVSLRGAFIEWYDIKISALNTKPQPEVSKTDEVEIKKELHNNIFIGNAFEVWQSMFGSFDIKESSRTDIRFMFDTMLKDKLIHNTVSQKNILDWITNTYQLTIEKPQFKDFKTDSKRNDIYKNAKTLYNK